MAGYENGIGMGFCDAGGDRADPSLGNQFHADLGVRIDLFQIVYELRQILDRIDIVMGRR